MSYHFDICKIPKMEKEDFVFQDTSVPTGQGNGFDQSASIFGCDDIIRDMQTTDWDKSTERQIEKGYMTALQKGVSCSKAAVLLIHDQKIVGIYTDNLLDILPNHRYKRTNLPCAQELILEAYQLRGMPVARRKLTTAGRRAFEHAYKLACQQC